MMSHTRLTGVISVILVISCILTTTNASDSSEEDDGTTCYYETYKTSLTHVNFTYDCYKTEETQPPCPPEYVYVPADVDDHPYHFHPRHSWRRHRRHRWKRQIEEDMCYRKVISQCTVIIRICIRKVIKKPYCCHGTRLDGSCVGSIECGDDNGGCEHVCMVDDTIGHHCQCFTGYKITHEKLCTDVDECAVDNGGCDQLCTNTDGGYYCSCTAGFVLDTPHTCAENNECHIGNGGCDHNCINTVESYNCTCDPGFVLDGPHNCIDVDDCTENNGNCSDICVNVYGDYYCSCPAGHILLDDAFHCTKEPNIIAPIADTQNLKESMLRPIILGPIIGGVVFIILLILATCCCLRRRRHRTPPPPPHIQTVPTVFVVGKKKKGAVLDAVEPGDRKAKMAEGNDYSKTPSRKKSLEKPPTYDDVLLQDQGPSAQPKQKKTETYENVDPPPRYEKPKMVDPEPATYTNLAYVSEMTSTSDARNPDKDNIQNEEIEEVPNPYATVIRGLRKTGREKK